MWIVIFLVLLLTGCGGPAGDTSQSQNTDSGIQETDTGAEETDASPDSGEDTSTGGTSGESGAGGSSGAAGSSGVGGSAGSGGIQDAAPDPICTPDEAHCQGLDVETCNSDGTSWDITQTCPFLCEDGACKGSCLPGSSQCDGFDVQSCNTQGDWTTVVACPFVCHQGACTGVCVPDTKKCEGLTPQVCGPLGQWKDQAPCPVLCTAGECTSGCTPGEKLCNGLELQTCTAGHVWEVTQTCPYVCSAGACTGVCTPGTTQCSGSTIQVCSSQGQWTSGSTCPAACLNGACVACTPGSTRCSGNTAEVCNSQGSWVTNQVCPTQCINGSCVSCTPGTRVCEGTSYKECGSTGSWGALVPCVGDVNASPTCSGAGVCGWTCNTGFEDCTSGAGCETNLSNPATCGSCTNACEATNGIPTCSGGTCGITCNAGWANCGPGGGCETPLGTLTNCLSCGDSCGTAGPNSSMTCATSGCTLVCNLTWGDCDGVASNGCEHDVWSDPLNCGVCGKNCYGGTCSAGVCSQELEVVTESPGTIGYLWVEGTNVYWSTTGAPGKIYKAPKSGGAPTLVATDSEAVGPIVTNGQDIVFRTILSNDLKRVSVNGGAVTTIKTLSHSLGDIGIDATNIYWNDQVNSVPDSNPTRVYRMPIAGGPSTLVATSQYSSRPWTTVDDTNIYILNDGPEYPGSSGLKHYGNVRIIPKGASGVDMDFSPSFSTVIYLGETKYFDTFGCMGVAVNDTHIFVHSRFANGGSGVVRATKGTLQTQRIGSGWDTFMTADASYLYSRYGSIFRMSVNGGNQNTFVEFNTGGSRVFLDATHAYWSVSSIKSVPFHAIMRAEK